MNILHSIGTALSSALIFVGSLFGFVPDSQIQAEPLAAALPSGTANFESALATGISDTATSMTLTSNAIRGGGTLSGYECFTIDEGSAQAEFVCGTISSTVVTGLERGISPADGITTDADLLFSHRRGASVKITDFPLLQRIRSQNSGVGTYESVLTYANGVTPSGGSDLVDVEYLTSTLTGTTTLSYNKIIVNGTAGETMATGSIVYLKASDSRWYKADNDLPETYVDQELGIAQGIGTSGSSVSNGILTYGLDSTQKSMTAGQFIFLSATAGATSTATTSQILGKAVTATTMFFDQNLIDSSKYTPTTFVSTTTFSSSVTFNATTSGTLGSSTIRTFSTGSSTYNLAPYLKHIVLEMIASGGGGGGSPGAAAGDSGGGGGAGGYCKKLIPRSALATTTSISLSGGGSGGGSGNTPGVVGGSAYFGGIATSTGGSGAGSGGSGGSGGTTTGCVLNGTGASGSGEAYSASSKAGGGAGTYGYGNGGDGGISNGAGNDGGTGIVIITEYF